MNDSTILAYENLEYGIVLNNIDNHSKQFFLNKVFSTLTNSEVAEFIELIEIYEKFNGSIKKYSENLFIHKNTVQYKLNKIQELTGYNPRNLNDFFILKLASILYKANI